jgi:kynurenine formamidase
VTEGQTALEDLGALLLSGGVTVVDLSAPLGPETAMTALPGEPDPPPPVTIHKISEYDADGPFFAWNWLELSPHSGTHLTAPRHWLAAGEDARGTDLPEVGEFVAPACVLDGDLTRDALKAWEDAHGAIRGGDWVVLRTGRQVPNVATEVLEELIGRGIAGLATDAPLLDPETGDRPVARALAISGRWVATGLTALDRLPATGAILICAPLKFTQGTGSPVRAMALIPD